MNCAPTAQVSGGLRQNPASQDVAMLSSLTPATLISGAITASSAAQTSVAFFSLVTEWTLFMTWFMLLFILTVFGLRGVDISPSLIRKESAITVLVKSPAAIPFMGYVYHILPM